MELDQSDVVEEIRKFHGIVPHIATSEEAKQTAQDYHRKFRKLRYKYEESKRNYDQLAAFMERMMKRSKKVGNNLKSVLWQQDKRIALFNTYCARIWLMSGENSKLQLLRSKMNGFHIQMNLAHVHYVEHIAKHVCLEAKELDHCCYLKEFMDAENDTVLGSEATDSSVNVSYHLEREPLSDEDFIGESDLMSDTDADEDDKMSDASAPAWSSCSQSLSSQSQGKPAESSISSISIVGSRKENKENEEPDMESTNNTFDVDDPPPLPDQDSPANMDVGLNDAITPQSSSSGIHELRTSSDEWEPHQEVRAPQAEVVRGAESVDTDQVKADDQRAFVVESSQDNQRIRTLDDDVDMAVDTATGPNEES